MSDQPSPSGVEPRSATTAAPTSVWEDFIDILHSPSAVFARRENGGFWVPMLVVTLSIAVIFFAIKGMLQPMMDAEFQRGAAAAMRKNPQITEDQLASMRNIQEKFSAFALIVFIPIGIFLTGIVLWLAGKLFDAKETLRTAIVVAAYAFVPKIIEIVLTAVQALVLDSSSFTSHYAVTLGLGRFLNPDSTSPILLALLGRVDVFTIWLTVLLAIGLSVTGRIPRSRAAMAAALVWLVGALPGVLGALRS
jgi:Yip1 domain